MIGHIKMYPNFFNIIINWIFIFEFHFLNIINLNCYLKLLLKKTNKQTF